MCCRSSWRQKKKFTLLGWSLWFTVKMCCLYFGRELQIVVNKPKCTVQPLMILTSVPMFQFRCNQFSIFSKFALTLAPWADGIEPPLFWWQTQQMDCRDFTSEISNTRPAKLQLPFSWAEGRKWLLQPTLKNHRRRCSKDTGSNCKPSCCNNSFIRPWHFYINRSVSSMEKMFFNSLPTGIGKSLVQHFGTLQLTVMLLPGSTGSK